ncbi:thioesterase-like superfamily-domain-containing protein [Paraphoma chrysanthemicola]|nr:thioesterase-like superfamily-domain-containing protein [Paraphoma chrysanthemicola]
MAKPEKEHLTFTDHLTLKPLGNDSYETAHPPGKMANFPPVAYGGYALATACKSAYLTVPTGYHLYSLQGNFLGPATTDRPFRANVRTVRQTRAFATRQVEVSQKRDDGGDRVCLIAIADFHVKEQASLLEYSKPPRMTYSHYETLLARKEAHQKHMEDGKITQKLFDAHENAFEGMRFFEQRQCPEAVFAQNLWGMAKYLPTTQDHLPTTLKTSAEWFRCLEPMATPIDNMTSMTWFADGAISILPLAFNHLWLEDISACSSLDFSLRFFKSGDEIDTCKWHLRELTTPVASEARSFGESWLFDEQGSPVAYMSQQSILRPKQSGKGKL